MLLVITHVVKSLNVNYNFIISIQNEYNESEYNSLIDLVMIGYELWCKLTVDYCSNQFIYIAWHIRIIKIF